MGSGSESANSEEEDEGDFLKRDSILGMLSSGGGSLESVSLLFKMWMRGGMEVGVGVVVGAHKATNDPLVAVLGVAKGIVIDLVPWFKLKMVGSFNVNVLVEI